MLACGAVYFRKDNQADLTLQWALAYPWAKVGMEFLAYKQQVQKLLGVFKGKWGTHMPAEA